MLSASVRRGYSLWAYNLGLLLGGTLIGLALSVVGAILQPAFSAQLRWVVLALVCAALLAKEVGLVRIRLPENPRLVPETVFRLGPVFGPLQFGIEMGTGVRTYVTSAVPYMTLAAVVFLGTPLHGLAAGAGFAAGRAAMATAGVLSGDVDAWDREWTRYDRGIRAAVALGFVGVLVQMWTAA